MEKGKGESINKGKSGFASIGLYKVMWLVRKDNKGSGVREVFVCSCGVRLE
jgi:hypothetical protein